MMSRQLFDQKTVGAILTCLMSAIILLGSSATPPLISISVVPEIESGTTVRIVGVLVDVFRYESGAEGLILSDLDRSAVVKAISVPGIKPQPSEYARTGDELLIEGEVGASNTSSVIFTNSDRVIVQRRSDLVLTVESVISNWYLFEGDVIRVKGILVQDELSLGLRLRDLTKDWSIAVLPGDIDLELSVGSTVTLTATLRFDRWSSALTLVPSYVVVDQ